MFKWLEINKERNFNRLCSKAITDHLPKNEANQLQIRIDEDENRARYLRDLKILWQQTDTVMPTEIPDSHQEWNQLACRLRLSAHQKPGRQVFSMALIRDYVQSIEVRTRWAMAVAAVLVFAAISIFHHLQPVRVEAIATHTAEKKYVRLPDGSEVWLNTVSEIQYPEKFAAKSREIKLTGEAYFVIVPDSKPFIVNTQNACTKVLGTAFNIWSRNDETRVIVKRGKVQLSRSEEDTLHVDLVKDQMSLIAKSYPPRAPKTVDAEYQIGWMEGRLLFEKVPLKDILDELERYYGVDIRLKDLSLEDKTMTAIFENRTLETVLSSLCLSLETDYLYQSEELIHVGVR